MFPLSRRFEQNAISVQVNMSTEILSQVLIIFLLAVVVNIVCSRFKIPVTVGFLLTGVLAGPSLLGLVDDIEVISSAADLGVAMLMFTIGMELSGEVLDRLKRPVFLGGSLQIGLIIGVAAVVGLVQGHLAQGIFWGCLFALSSSAIVLHIFQQKGITATPVGRLTLAILVFQDILVAPMMLLVPLLAGTIHLSFLSAGIAILKVIAFGAALYVFARWILDRLMTAVAKTRSSELLLLTILCLCLGFATITSALGMSFSLGAFLAGLMLARSRYSMSAVADILPYRDVFLSIFFISVGMMLDVSFTVRHILFILACVPLYIIGKSLLTMPAVLIQGYPLQTAIRTSLCLSQTGEFSFVLVTAGVASGLMGNEAHQFFLAVSIITMMLTPALIACAPATARKICSIVQKKGKAQAEVEEEHKDGGLKDHCIIIGFGFTGQQLVKAAKHYNLAYTILEMNPETVKRFSDKEPIAYGDAVQPIILESLGIAQARVIAIAISDPMAVRGIIANARKLNPDITIIARTRFVGEIRHLYALGANKIIAEEFEAGVEMFSQVLAAYLLPAQDIDKMAAKLRQEESLSMRHASKGAGLQSLTAKLPDMGVCAVRLEEGSPFVNHTLLESNIRKTLGLTIVAVSRNNELIQAPDASFMLLSDDVVYVFTTKDKIYTARQLLNPQK